MKKWYAYIILLASVLFASCNIEDTLFPDQECDTKTEPVNVRLILSMMGGRSLSRAPLTDTPTTDYLPDEKPLGNEYYINPYDVEVLVFTCGETPEKSTFVERASMVRATPTDNYHEYQLDGTLTEVNGEKNYHVVLLANLHGSSYCNNFTTPTTGTTMSTFLEGLTYTSYNAAFTSKLLEEDSTERIPMWGITTTKLTDGTTISLNLLRSMAKVKVKMKKGDNTLSAVTLDKANNGGCITPLLNNGISSNGQTARVQSTHIPIPQSVEPIKGITDGNNILSFTKISNDTDQYDEFVIFVPEYNNLDVSKNAPENALSTAASMKLTINGKDYKLEFKDYAQENPTGYFDIVRNYFYDYTITGVKDNDIDLTLSVQKWSVESETMNYEDHVSVTQSGQIKWYIENNEVTPDISDEEKRALVTLKNGSITCQFNIDSPKEGTWYASLNQFGENTNAFKFSSATQTSSDGNNYASVLNNSTASGQCGKGQVTLVIETTGDQPIRVNNMAELQFVVVTSDGRTITVKELLNSTTYGTIDKYTLIQPIQ